MTLGELPTALIESRRRAVDGQSPSLSRGRVPDGVVVHGIEHKWFRFVARVKYRALSLV
jgi:hypothetical protein